MLGGRHLVALLDTSRVFRIAWEQGYSPFSVQLLSLGDASQRKYKITLNPCAALVQQCFLVFLQFL